MVIALMAVMIVGMLIVVTLLISRLGAPASPTVPEAITLPEGTTPVAVTIGPGWYAVATETDFLIFNEAGQLTQSVPITPN